MNKIYNEVLNKPLLLAICTYILAAAISLKGSLQQTLSVEASILFLVSTLYVICKKEKMSIAYGVRFAIWYSFLFSLRDIALYITQGLISFFLMLILIPIIYRIIFSFLLLLFSNYISNFMLKKIVEPTFENHTYIIALCITLVFLSTYNPAKPKEAHLYNSPPITQYEYARNNEIVKGINPDPSNYINKANKAQVEKVAIQSNVHYVGVYEGTSKNNNASHSRGTVNVRVTVKNKPIILILSSYEPVQWNIIPDWGVRFEKVIISGYYKQTYTGLMPNVPVLNSSYEERNGNYFYQSINNEDNYLDIIEKIESLTGKKPVTVQSNYTGTAFTVDGRNTMTFAKKLQTSDTPVVLECSYDCNLSADKLTARYGHAGASTGYKASKCYSSGKWYFETKLNVRGGATHPDTWTNFGIASSSSNGDFNAPTDEYGYAYGAVNPWNASFRPQELNNNDILGVAMDLDNNKLYFSQNGTWKAEINIKTQRTYCANVSLSAPDRDPYESDSFTVNFGDRGFKYNLPKGYKPYQ